MVIPGMQQISGAISRRDYYTTLREFELFWPKLNWDETDEHINVFLEEINEFHKKLTNPPGFDIESKMFAANLLSQSAAEPLAMKYYRYTWKRLFISGIFREVQRLIPMAGDKFSGENLDDVTGLPPVMSSNVK